MKNKLISIITALSLAVCLTGCDSSKDSDTVSSYNDKKIRSMTKASENINSQTEPKQTNTTEESSEPEIVSSTDEHHDLLSSADEIELRDTNGMGKNYLFTYDGEDFTAIYTEDNWKIIDSYKIENTNNIEIICSALIAIHPIHGADMISYRTPQDMAYEWEQHNLAYRILPPDSKWRANAKDVDLDPADQDRNLYEIFKDRTGN